METKGEKSRAAYFSEGELEVLMLAYEEYKPIIMKKSNTAAYAKERQLAWQKITDRVNACNPSGAKRTLCQVKMKHKNILQKANRKKAEARLTGGGPPPPPLTPSEELALSLNKGRPVVDGIPEGTSSEFASSHNNSSDLVQFADGRIVLLDPPETTQSVTIDDDEETTSAVTELESAGRPTENVAGDVNADEGPTTSTSNLSSLSAKELYKVHLLRQIKKSDMDMDLIQLQQEEKRLAIKKAKLEIKLLEHRLKDLEK
ncbi:uncharacterized protein LOC120491741 [Pimephales promelas]|uniref:uncharacterized protein LOC120486856 n=1 Tax=Pimephales promelas TaxID=90988 RepID=UPI00195572D1|nr:uncharacterized protein LOC120486856 [Pimephales promelas]XP_039545680.1 uncharacterized protein LOC120491741 [Pimephales promelas]